MTTDLESVAAGGAVSVLGATVRRSLTSLPSTARVAVRVTEQRVGEIVKQIFDDTRAEEGSPRLHVPIARTESESGGVVPRPRRPGAVYVEWAGGQVAEGDPSYGLLLELRELFPVLHVWPELPPRLDLSRPAGDGAGGHQAPGLYAEPTPQSEPDVLRYEALSVCILAVDVAGENEDLAIWTAYLGVPTVGSARNPWQRLLWPDLALDARDGPSPVRAARSVLTDYPLAAAMSRHALRSLHACVPAARMRDLWEAEAKARGRACAAGAPFTAA